VIVRSFIIILLLVAVFMPALPVAATPVRGGVPVLMYHKVDPQVPSDRTGRSLTIDPAVFAAQLAWLRAHGIRTITMDDLAEALRRGQHPQHAVVLTFDDGYNDAADVVTPLLRRYGDRASFYVSAAFIGDGRHAGWTKLRTMRGAGMEIGCHGSHHLDLTTLSRAGASREVNGCVAALTHYLARPTTYAYPAGRFNGTTLALMRAAGMKAALTEIPGAVTTLAQPYALPRRRIGRDTGMASFAALATP
jgi:peptidoglycan/xylan/chitin deacetylase (PgdA/CDA1 family)